VKKLGWASLGIVANDVPRAFRLVWAFFGLAACFKSPSLAGSTLAVFGGLA